MSEAASVQNHRFEAEVSQLLKLVINSLYSNKEIFLRELLSNASDALDKLRFRALTEPALLPKDSTLRIQIIPDKDKGTLTIWDNGIGMSLEELCKNLGTIAHSGSKAFLEQLQQGKGQDIELIGQFGVGFYSAYLVADHVEVVSLAAGARQAHKWASDAQESFSISDAGRVEQGSAIVLHLKADQREYLEEHRLRHLVQRYSDYLSYPIELKVQRPASDAPDAQGEEASEQEGPRFERINQGQALWQRPSSSLGDEHYAEFYKHLTHDWEPPLAHKHFKLEGTHEFTGLLFLPKRPPADLFLPESKHGVRLHVRRVFVMDDCEAVLPKWLRFFRGVLDSEDLPLNVSRETLQDSAIVRTMRKQVVKQALDLLQTLAKDRPEDYALFWQNFGAVLKEGLHFEPSTKERVLPLLRFASSTREDLVSLADYKDKALEEQKAIYYALGDSSERLKQSPHLEVLHQRGFEVLLLTDPVDPWAVAGLGEYEGLPFVAASDADLKLDSSATDKAESTVREGELKALIERMRQRLQDHISEVKLSTRLTDSPLCLVVPEGALPPHMERLLRAAQQSLPTAKRILEINPGHPLITNLERLLGQSEHDARVDAWIDLLYQQALLAEGASVDNPAAFARQVTELLQEVTAQLAA